MGNIEAAAKAMYETVYSHLKWADGSALSTYDTYRKMARAALPHLATWDEPTDAEIIAAHRAHYTHLTSEDDATSVLRYLPIVHEFVRRRNDKLKPPVDKRREAIEKVLAELIPYTGPVVDRILSAIDSVAAE